MNQRIALCVFDNRKTTGNSRMTSSEDVYRVQTATVLAENWGRLTRYEFDLKTSKGEWERQVREIYDHGDGVACLLYDETYETVLLIRQFRLPSAITGGETHPLEVPAGILEGNNPERCMIRELEEETGYKVNSLDQHQAIYMSPGSFSERIHLFTGSYNQQDRSSKGGGNPDEGEDIEIVHLHFGEALGMIDTGTISDAKTIILLQQFAIKNRMR